MNGHYGATLGHIGSHVITRGHPIEFHQDTLLVRDITLSHKVPPPVLDLPHIDVKVSLGVTEGHIKSPLKPSL